MNKRALALLCVPLLMAAAPKPRHAAPSTHCALAKYFNAHETECNRPKKKPHAGAVAAQASKQAAARKEPVLVTAKLSGLATAATYHYRIVATSSQGSEAGRPEASPPTQAKALTVKNPFSRML